MPRKTLIKHRRDTKDNWVTVNPVLSDGEPGIETDTNRTKMGNGVSTWNQLGYQNMPFYGAFQDETNQSILDPVVAYAIKLGITDFSNGVSVVTDGVNPTKIQFAHAGLYNIQWSGQFGNTNSLPKDVVIWLRKNGTDVLGSAGHVTVPGKHAGVNGASLAAWNYYVSVNAGENVQFMWHADDTGITLTTYPVGVNPATPATASVIVTVQQVA